MKIFPFIFALAVVAGWPVFTRAEVADGVQAVVHGQAISFSEVQDYSRPAVEALRRQYVSQPDVLEQKLHETVSDSLNQLVERQLILHSFEAEGYQLPEGVVDDLVQERIRERYGDRLTLIKTLQAQGLTFEQFRKQVREQYIESALRNQKVQREIILSPYKVQSYYLAHQDKFKLDDQVKLRMIVLTKASADDKSTAALAREIQAQIKGGAKFAEMASIYSQGSQQHQEGDWGWVERSVLRKELADTAFTLAPGQVSEVIDTIDTVYLMLVEDRKPSQARPLKEVRADIEKTLLTQQQATLQKQWMDGLKKKTFVRYFQ
ncbi:MAG: peptidyl-prolyl cis-trans isomerase [Verrucomicrobiota bacterium]